MKRILSAVLVLALMLSALCVNAWATESAPLAPEEIEEGIAATLLVDGFWATLSQGNSTGKLVLTYYVSALISSPTKIGVQRINVYRANGTLASSIIGTTSNGLIGSGTSYRTGTYTLSLSAGTGYYCDVLFVVANASGSEKVEDTTICIAAPY
jgi:hypothetical protein